MAERDEITQALIKVAEEKSPQSKLLRKYFDAIEEALEGGATVAELLKVLKEKTGVAISIRWAYKVLQKERKKRTGQPAKQAKVATPKPVEHPAPAPMLETQSGQNMYITHSEPDNLSIEDYIAMPLDGLPSELKSVAMAEISDSLVDVRGKEPPVRFGSSGDDSLFADRMKAMGWAEGSAEYMTALAELRQKTQMRKDYRGLHRKFMSRAIAYYGRQSA